jgi:hypothetical protein
MFPSHDRGGTAVQKEYRGKAYTAWTDGLQEWKPFRIPRKANTNEPEYQDVPMSYSLEEHAEAIGMTGWDWKNKVSKWVGFDFDSMIGHKTGLSQEELDEVFNAVKEIPWVTIRYSTSGEGYHVYVYLDDFPTKNHTEHAALGRAILDLMCVSSGHDLRAKIDVCGGNMWVWSRRMHEEKGYQVLKLGSMLSDVPDNWKDYLSLTKGINSRVEPRIFKDGDKEAFFDLTSQRNKMRLTPRHKYVLDYLIKNKMMYAWYQDYNMLITHTGHLLDAHKELGLRGVFKTVAAGKDQGDHNCYLFPLKDGAWAVRRYTKGVTEAETWEQDGNGWTMCYYNQDLWIVTGKHTS